MLYEKKPVHDEELEVMFPPHTPFFTPVLKDLCIYPMYSLEKVVPFVSGVCRTDHTNPQLWCPDVPYI